MLVPGLYGVCVSRPEGMAVLVPVGNAAKVRMYRNGASEQRADPFLQRRNGVGGRAIVLDEGPVSKRVVRNSVGGRGDAGYQRQEVVVDSVRPWL